MKRAITFLLFTLFVMSMSAYDFKSGNFYYNITSDVAPYTVEVTYETETYYENYRVLSTATIPASVTYNGTTYSVTSIGEKAFFLSKSLTSVTIPNSVTSIGYWAFYGCSALTSIAIPNSVTSIGWNVFNDCNSLTSITIPNSVTSIGKELFASCASLSSVVVEPGNTTYDSRENCNAIIETATNTLVVGCNNSIIPNTVTSIGDSAFRDCDLLTSITIPKSVTSIGRRAFSFCYELNTMVVEEGNTTYDSRENCNAIIETATNTLVAGCKNTIIPNTVTSIGGSAFINCTSLTSITCEATTPPVLELYVFPSELTTAYIPCGTKSAYEASDWASQVSEFIEEDCVDPTWQITYTSTDGNIVTPYKTDVFGANIVSNTYQDGQGVITFDGPVTSIGDYAFHFCQNLASITIPNSVTTIGDLAFSECSSLVSITIPNSVTSIHTFAFADCSSLIEVEIPKSVISIGDSDGIWWACQGIFMGCNNLQKIVVEEGNPIFDSRDNCNAIIETATNALIAGCPNTEIPNGIKRIGAGAFRECNALRDIDIPSSVNVIGEAAFYGTRITNVVIPSNAIVENSTKGSQRTALFGAFAGCEQLTDIVIPEGTTRIASGMLAGCSSLESLTIPASVTSIGEWAFYDCDALTSITIPNGVTSIEEGTFMRCSKLTSITIPSGVTNIGYYAFGECILLSSVICEATTPPMLEDLKGSPVFTSSPICYIPCGTKAAYEASDWAQYVSEFVEEDCPEPIDPTWQITYTSTDDNIVTPYKTDVFGANIVSNTYQDGQGVITFDGPVTSIGDYAFHFCQNLASIFIPNSVTSIGSYAFDNCDSLTSVTIGNSVTSIGSYAFDNCDLLTSVTIGNSVKIIGDAAFNDCSSLTSIAIPNSVTSIHTFAFARCSSLVEIEIPKSVISIGDSDDGRLWACQGIFMGCNNLQKIIVEEGNPIFDSRDNCNAIIETATNTLIAGCPNTEIPNGIKRIGTGAFRDCNALGDIDIPSSVNVIGYAAFYGTGITNVVIPSNCIVEDADATYSSTYTVLFGAFARCEQLTDIVIPEGTTRIASGMLAGCSSLESLTIPASVTSIGEWAFYDCDALTSITIPNGVTSIEEGTFMRCSKLTSITIPSGVTNIGYYAFGECILLSSVICEATTPPMLEDLKGSPVFTSSPICYIPCGTKSAYEASDWAQYVSEFIEDCDYGSYTRTVRIGYNTICLPHGSSNFTGATFYEIAHILKNKKKIFFDEVKTLEAGKPYIFYPHSNAVTVYYDNTTSAVPLSHNGLHGTFDGITAASNFLKGKYLVAGDRMVLCGDGCSLAANRAYIVLDEISDKDNPAIPGIKRVSMDYSEENATTALDNITDESIVAPMQEGVYDILGRKVDAPTISGFYIINGKKVFVK